MDKTIERVFELTPNTQSGVNTLFMHSRVDGEFGTVVCTCFCELNGDLIAARIPDNGEPDGGFAFRLHELQYFVSFIIPLFNPYIHTSHEIPQLPASQSPQP